MLTLSSLEKIIISNNFTNDVIETQKKYKLNITGHSNSDDAVAIAKVVHTCLDDELRQTIIINIGIIWNLFSFEKFLVQLSVHYIYHELCHVHDEHNKHDIYSKKTRKGTGFNVLEHHLNSISDMLWAEYIAVRLSSHTLCFVPKEDLPTNSLYFDYLIQLIEKYKKEIKEEIKNYRHHADIDKLSLLVQEKCNLLLRIAVTVIGYFDGLIEIGLQNDTYKLIENTHKDFYNIILRLNDELKTLYNKYPEWNDIHELKKLGEIVIVCWQTFGIYVEYDNKNDSIYVDVPL